MSEYRKYEIKYILLVIFYGAILLIGLLLLFTQARYQSQVKLNATVENAIHIIKPTDTSFNISVEGMIPRDEPYLYIFNVANYDTEKQSEVDMEYTLSLITTTNLPLTYELYKNETYDAPGATNIITNITKQDEDNAWYNELSVTEPFTFNYSTRTIDTYYLYVHFDSIYKKKIEYAGVIDNVQIKINAKQII